MEKNNFLERIFFVGTSDEMNVIDRNRIHYFNVVLLALPVVYFLFILYSFEAYLRPVSDWKFDQYNFFIFVAICLFCYFLNHWRLSLLSKILFLISWPVILHIIPIIIQHTPTDYYFAFPMGVIFHSLMIQALFSSKRTPMIYALFIGTNLALCLNFMRILIYFDTEGGGDLKELINNPFYVLIALLYWLLINLILFYIGRVIDSTSEQLVESSRLVANQKSEIESTLRELKDSNDKLLQSEKMASLGVFTAGIAHELNNPMNFISTGVTIIADLVRNITGKLSGNTDMLDDEVSALAKAKEGIEVGVRRSTEIIDNLSKYARPSSEEYEENDLVECIQSSIALFPQSYLHNVELVVNLPDQLMIKCNASKLSQVIVNLVQNAIDATENGRVEVSLIQGKKGFVTIKISDNGSGMDKKTLDKIYDPFFTTKEVGRGTGLGLYIVFAVIKEHKGNIEVKSKENMGTEFSITLPMT